MTQMAILYAVKAVKEQFVSLAYLGMQRRL